MLISTEKGKIKVGTTNSEAVVSISSIELHVFKSQLILQKVQTKSTISESLVKIDPVFKSGNKNLENKNTREKKNVHFKTSGMFVEKKHTTNLYFFHLF